MSRAFGAAAAMLLGAGLSAASAQAVTCPDGSPVDGLRRAGDSRQCLVMRRIEPAALKSPVLVVFLHGDSGGKTDLGDDRSPAPALSSRLGAVTLALQRPGYDSPSGRSDGQAGPGGDDLTPANIAAVAGALHSVRTRYPGRPLLLVGYAGGAATAALLASRHPGSADAYLLVACPCDLPGWRQWRQKTGDAAPWDRSLSPLAETAGIRPGTLVSVVAGSRDENTLPAFSEAYVGALQARGIQTRLTYASGATHVSVLRSPEFFMLAEDLAGRLSRLARPSAAAR